MNCLVSFLKTNSKKMPSIIEIKGIFLKYIIIKRFSDRRFSSNKHFCMFLTTIDISLPLQRG